MGVYVKGLALLGKLGDSRTHTTAIVPPQILKQGLATLVAAAETHDVQPHKDRRRNALARLGTGSRNFLFEE